MDCTYASYRELSREPPGQLCLSSVSCLVMFAYLLCHCAMLGILSDLFSGWPLVRPEARCCSLGSGCDSGSFFTYRSISSAKDSRTRDVR